ncbi:hypothetical protein CYMTET_11670 [Cymbomonas tetramitiformis]|uniref:Uncharacterized protein n=1 Tax=Cymbomonas tetramitiformis TaxID=36881 RepID=A0AAE0LD87_9CHLO|nr:hypothetical protein CYMTET_11670 [Cymbomonas tetramitiformis]
MADTAAKKACEQGEYGPNHDNSQTIMLRAMIQREGEGWTDIEGHMSIYKWVLVRVRREKEATPSRLSKLKRELDTQPKHWEMKNQKIEMIKRSREEQEERERRLDQEEANPRAATHARVVDEEEEGEVPTTEELVMMSEEQGEEEANQRLMEL